jgi:DNA-binding transcriptional LysR family regulator
MDMLKVAMGLGNAEAIEIAVEEGIGIAFISRLAATRGLDLGRIVEVDVEGMSLHRKIYIARNQRFPSTRAQSEFWNFVLQPVTEQVDQLPNMVPEVVNN